MRHVLCLRLRGRDKKKKKKKGLALSKESLTFAICHCILSETIHRSQSGDQYRSLTECFSSLYTVAYEVP
jgi:hypothetical protein